MNKRYKAIIDKAHKAGNGMVSLTVIDTTLIFEWGKGIVAQKRFITRKRKQKLSRYN